MSEQTKKTKKCSQCKIDKPLNQFAISKKGKFGRASQCKDCVRAYASQYRATHPETIHAATRRYLEKHRMRHNDRNTLWRLKNPRKAQKAHAEWYRQNKPTVCLQSRLRETLGKPIRRDEIWKLLGYTYDDFITHIEQRFLPGMTWQNHGQWELDHIVPISAFHIKSPDDPEFRKCWSLHNIQPMWKAEHKRKGAKLLMTA